MTVFSQVYVWPVRHNAVRWVVLVERRCLLSGKCCIAGLLQQSPEMGQVHTSTQPSEMGCHISSAPIRCPPKEAMYQDLTDALAKHPDICQQIHQAFPTASAFQIKDLKIICSSASKGHGSQVPHADCLVPDGAFGIVHLQDQSETTLFVPRDKRLGPLNKPRGVVECCHCKQDRVPSQQA